MEVSPPSPFAWPTLTALTTIYLPLAVALGGQRSVRTDPVARVALGWAVLGIIDLVSLLQILDLLPDQVRATIFAAPLALLLFVPPLLSWMGRDARRFTWPALALTLTASAIGMAVLGTGREFRVVASPVAGAILATLSAAALTWCCWRAPGVPWRMDWSWVLAGMVIYYALGIVWVPLAEFLVPRSWTAVVDLHMGMVLVHVGAYLLIARGASIRPAAQADPPRWTAAAPETA